MKTKTILLMIVLLWLTAATKALALSMPAGDACFSERQTLQVTGDICNDCGHTRTCCESKKSPVIALSLSDTSVESSADFELPWECYVLEARMPASPKFVPNQGRAPPPRPTLLELAQSLRN